MGAKLYSQAELEEIFRRRLSDQDDLIGKVAERAVAKVAEQIKPEFEAVNDRLDGLTDQVRLTNGSVHKHAVLFEELGVVELSQDERQALPEVLVEHMQSKENRRRLDRRERRRNAGMQVAMTFIGTVAGCAVAAAAILGALRALGVIH